MVLAVLFVIASIWLWTIADEQQRRSPLFVKGLSIIGVVFFGTGIIVFLIQLFDKRPGLIIDQDGIQINSGMGKGYFVSWHIITGFEVFAIKSTRLIAVFVNDPERLISAEKPIKRQLMRANLQYYGAPICLTAGTLKIGTDDLVKLLKSRLALTKNTASGNI